METKKNSSKESAKRNGEKPNRNTKKSMAVNKKASGSYGKGVEKKGYLSENGKKIEQEKGVPPKGERLQNKSGKTRVENVKVQGKSVKLQESNGRFQGERGKQQERSGKRQAGNRIPREEQEKKKSERLWEGRENLQERDKSCRGKEGTLKKKDEISQGKSKNLNSKTGESKSRNNESSVKRNSLCKAFGECGGCQLIDTPYNEQLTLKKKKVANILKPFVKLEGIIGMETPEHYRNKVNAAFTHDKKGKPLSGVYKEGTHYIIPIEECLLENEKADKIIGSIRELLPSFKIKTYDESTGYGLLRHVMVRVGHASGQIMVVLVLASPIMPSKNNFVKALLKLHPDITTIVINVNDRKTSMVLGSKEQVIYGKGYIEDTLNGKLFKISPKSFYQINSVQTERLYGKAIEYAGLTGKETILDAYCGIGTIGIIAADKVKKVIGVELNKDAVKDAIINAKKNEIQNIQFYQKDAGEFMVQLAEQGEKIDTVFMDPPRAGSDEIFLNSLATSKPKKIVYVSCNPETLARDLEYLVKKGYRVERGVAVDMFPFTNHVETVVLLEQKG